MKIKIEVPADATVKFDETTREIIVEPLFTKTDGRSTWAYVTVCGDGGAVRRATLQCSGKSGQTYVLNTTNTQTTTNFDKLSTYVPSRKKSGPVAETKAGGSIL
jgi:hypothetical protein